MLNKLFTTPAGIAVLALGASALIMQGTRQKVEKSDIFQPRQSYDYRNAAKKQAMRSPWSHPSAPSLPVNTRKVRQDHRGIISRVK
jgi:hypothetical protein